MAQTPLLLVGPPGIGKTQGVAAYARALGLPLWSQVVSEEDAIDTCGVIRAVQRGAYEVSERLLPAYWRAACDAPYVLFFDEITAGVQEQLASVLRATDLTRTMGGATLHEHTMVIAACNPPECAAGAARELSAPALNRFRIRRIGIQPAIDWMQGGPGLILAPHAVPAPAKLPVMVRLVGTYLKRNPAAAMATQEHITTAVAQLQPFPSLRAWTRAATEAPHEPETWGEWVGDPAAAGFISWYKLQELPDPFEIVAGREKTIPSRGDSVMATAGAVLSAWQEDGTDTGLGHAFTWYARAAENGHAANCAVAVSAVIACAGDIRAARYIGSLEGYAALIKRAGV